MDLKVCRVCGGVDKLKNILDQGIEMMDKLLVCADINVQNPEDLLPKLICEQCNKNLDLFYHLRKQSDATQKRLRQELKKTQNDLKSDNVSVDIIEQNVSLVGVTQNRTIIPSSHTSSQFKQCEKYIGTMDVEGNSINAEHSIDEQNASYRKQKKYMAFDRITDKTFHNVNNLEEEEVTTTGKITRGDDETSNSSHDDLIMLADEKEDMKLQKPPNVAILSNFCTIDLLSSSSLSSTNDCVDTQNDQLRPECSKLNFVTCATCNEIFSTNRQYREHIKQHGKERYQCIQCCKFFSTRFRLKRHEETHKEIISYQCSYCNRSYRALYNLNRHIQSAHLGEKSWECDICNYSFSRVDVLRRHMELHSDEKKYKCLLCDQRFKTKDYLYAHNRTYHTENMGTSKTSKPNKTENTNKKKCGYCGKLFKSSFAYKNHLLIHTNDKPYECATCQKKFRTIAALTIHQRVHDDYRPYQCDKCLKSFKQTSHLKEHKLLHSDTTPQYVCSICQGSFAKKSNLKAHIRIHNTEKPFKCADCSAEFSFMYLLQRHAFKVHNRSVHKVYTTNDSDQSPEADDSINSRSVESDKYHYINTVTDDDDDDDDGDDNFYYNEANVVDLITDNQEMHLSSQEFGIVNDNVETKIEQHIFNESYNRNDGGPIKDWIEMHSFSFIQSQLKDDLAKDIVDENYIEKKVDLFVSEDTKLTSYMNTIIKLE